MLRVIVCLIAAAPLAAWAADSAPEQSFFKHAAEGGLAEIDAATLAESKANNPAVKEFASMMVKDHSAANDKLKSLAESKGVKLPSSPSITQKAQKAKLDLLSGDSFDKSYIKEQIAAHQQTVQLFRKEVASGTDPDVQAFAKQTLPTLQAHLKKIRQIAAQEGIVASTH